MSHYALGYEAHRLNEGRGRLEFVRTWEIIHRYLPPPPAVVVDIGGGTGAYALPLANEGYEVHLFDPMPNHVEEARRRSGEPAQEPLARAEIAEARAVPFDRAADVVLLFGPLYHLTSRDERVAALREAHRILRASGVLFAAAISYAASTMDGLAYGVLQDERFEKMVARAVAEGQHRNDTGEAFWFTTAFFHRPQELVEEIVAAGLHVETTVAVEGPAQMVTDIETWLDDDRLKKVLLDAIRRIEADPGLLAATGHLLAVARSR